MGQRRYRIHIRKDSLKFAAAHLTVFPDGTKEALHGHNYTTELSVDLHDASLDEMIAFSVFKGAMKVICRAWDEKVLIAENCPYLKIKSRSRREIEFLLCRKRYVLPADETVLLPVDNITAEKLAEEFCRRLVESLDPVTAKAVVGLELRVDESPGQGATCFWEP